MPSRRSRLSALLPCLLLSLVLLTGLTGAPGATAADAPRSQASTVPVTTGVTVPVSGWVVVSAGQGLLSADGRFRLVMQGDGNLVEYNARGQAIWHTGTHGHPGAFLAVQADGNLVVYTASFQPVWASGSRAPAGSLVVLQDDANLVLYGPGPIWANGATDSTVSAPGRLASGDWLVSPDRRFTAIMQTDGNLVVYGPGNSVIWASGTQGNPGAWLAVQGDGNVVVYSADGRPLWASGTFAAGVALRVTSAGSLEVVNAGGRLWPVVGVQVPYRGTGTFAPADFPAGIGPNAAGRTVRFSVEIEGGVITDPTAFAGAVAAILLDARGWQSLDGIRFEPISAARVAAGERVDVRVTLASPYTVDRLCAPLPTNGVLSCWNGSRAVINAVRWRDGAATYGTDLVNYRTYLISHEVGHGVGHHHASCPAPGRRAPVMVQQTISLGGCTAWPWPRQP